LFELEEAARFRIYLTINIVGTNIIMKIFEWFEHGWSIVMIKKDLEFLKVLPPTGKKQWSVKPIEYISTNERLTSASLG